MERKFLSQEEYYRILRNSSPRGNSSPRRNSSPGSRGVETIVAHAEIIAHGLLFSVLDKDKVTPESMFNGYGVQINVSNEGIDIVPSLYRH